MVTELWSPMVPALAGYLHGVLLREESRQAIAIHRLEYVSRGEFRVHLAAGTVLAVRVETVVVPPEEKQS